MTFHFSLLTVEPFRERLPAGGSIIANLRLAPYNGAIGYWYYCKLHREKQLEKDWEHIIERLPYDAQVFGINIEKEWFASPWREKYLITLITRLRTAHPTMKIMLIPYSWYTPSRTVLALTDIYSPMCYGTRDITVQRKIAKNRNHPARLYAPTLPSGRKDAKGRHWGGPHYAQWLPSYLHTLHIDTVNFYYGYRHRGVMTKTLGPFIAKV